MSGNTFAITHHAFSSEQEGQQTETEATGAPQKHHHTLNQQVGRITQITTDKRRTGNYVLCCLTIIDSSIAYLKDDFF